jgi:hypothetical protein
MTEPRSAKSEERTCRTAGRPWSRPGRLVLLSLAWAVALALIYLPAARTRAAEPAKPAKPDKQDKYAWRPLFDGKTLKEWKKPNFGGEGKVEVRDGAIAIDMGESMSGITYTGQLPKIDYEISLEAKRTKGNDFFATTTFPVGDSHASFVVGGWGGTVVGISSIDHFDASENATTKFSSFKDNRWYKVRIRVTKAKIECWIDDDKLVDFETKEHKISIRMECDLCRPLGISTWCTGSSLRNIKIRNLTPDEAAAPPAKSE